MYAILNELLENSLKETKANLIICKIKHDICKQLEVQTMIQKQIFESLKSLKDDVRQRYKADLKGIFGSFARNEIREDSDIDIMVEFWTGATLLDLTGLGNFLEEKLHRKVDIVSHRAIRKELKANIYKDMIYL